MPAFKHITCSSLLCLAFVGQMAAAQVPGGGTVVGGAATIHQTDPAQQVINQTTQRAIIDWQDFSIGAGNSVRFNQPNASSIMLNRVVGANPSNIFGSLTANGQVFLVNPYGVYFGAGASVDVAGLFATTLGIRNDDFMSGNYVFNRDSSFAARNSVINDGILKAREGGYVVLAGDYAANRGVVQARLGTVALASGSKMTLDINGDSLINFTVNEKTVADLSGVDNSGQMLADGGRAIMTAAVARDLAAATVNNSGLIQAQTTVERDGGIYLSADGGTALVSGTLDASGLVAGQKGGTIDVLGQQVGLLDQAVVDASGDAGGGTIRIGGAFQGQGPQANAQKTSVGKDVSIKADAIHSGNGGEVVVWSDKQTRFYGDISARGGAQGGDGGNVEVSGKELLDFNGTVNTMAAQGNAGTLLLDPTDIQIITSVGATPDLTAGSPFGDLTNNGGTSQMSVGALEGALAAGNVTVRTTTSSGTAPLGGTITIDDGGGGGLQWGTANQLRLQADNQILIKAHIGAGSGTLWLDAANGVTQDSGWVTNVGSMLLTGGGAFRLYGGGSSAFISSYNQIGTLAANLSSGSSVQIAANSNMVIGSVAGVNGVTIPNGSLGTYLDQNNARLQLTQNVTASSLYLRNQGGTLQTGGNVTASSVTLLGGYATLNSTGNDFGSLSADINGALSVIDKNQLTIGGSGVTTTNHNVTIKTGAAPGYDNKLLPTTTSPANPASLTLNESINAGIGIVDITAGNGGVFQRHDVVGGALQPNGSITALGLVMRGDSTSTVTPFVLTNGNNNVGTLAASVNGSVSYTGAALTVGTVAGVSGITTTANTIVVPASGDADAVYNDNNVSLSIGGNLTIAQNINAASAVGSGAVSIGIGGEFTATTSSGKRINANTLGVFGGDGTGYFNLVTNVSSLAAGGGNIMVINNSAYTGALTGIGLGGAAASQSVTDSTGTTAVVNSDAKPVGDFYLTTGGDLTILKFDSKGKNVLFRADKLDIVLDAKTGDNARIMLQPYTTTNKIGVNSETEAAFAGGANTNYSEALLRKFINPVATFYFGEPDPVIWADTFRVESGKLVGVLDVARNRFSGDISIGYDGAMDLGYSSLSAQTSAANLVAHDAGHLYNLRLSAPNVTVKAFSTFGDKMEFFSNKLSLPSAASKYVNPNKPYVTLRTLNDQTIWAGTSPVAGEPQFLPSTIMKLPDWSKIVIGGVPNYPFPNGGAGYGDIHIPWNPSVSLGNRKLTLSTNHRIYEYTAQPVITKDSTGTAGKVWQGCQNLTVCKGANPNPNPDPSVDPGGSGGGDSGSGDTTTTTTTGGGCVGCPPAPPVTDPFPPDTTPPDTSTGGTTGGGTGLGDGGTGSGDGGTGLGDGGAGLGDGGTGLGDGGAGLGGDGTGLGDGGAGLGGDGTGLGDGGAGLGDGGTGLGDGGAGLGDGGTGLGDGGAGLGGDGTGLGDGGAGLGDGGTGLGDGGAGLGGDGTGLGDGGAGLGDGGTGLGDGGAGLGGDGTGLGDGGAGLGDGGTGLGDGGAGLGGDGTGLGDGGAGLGDGGTGLGDGGAGLGDGGTGLGDGGAGLGDGGTGLGDGGAGLGGDGTGLGDGGAGLGDGGTGLGDGGAGLGGDGTGLGDGGAGLGDGGTGLGDGGAGLGGDGTGLGDGGAGLGDGGTGLGDGGAGLGGDGTGLGDGGAGLGDGGTGLGDGGAGLGDGGTGLGDGGAGLGGDGTGLGDGGAGLGDGGTGLGDGGAGLGGDGTGLGDGGAGLGDGGTGLGDGSAGQSGGGAGLGDGGAGLGDAGTGLGDGGDGLGGDGTGLGDGGAGLGGDGTGLGDGSAGQSGGGAGLGDGGAGLGDAGTGLGDGGDGLGGDGTGLGDGGAGLGGDGTGLGDGSAGQSGGGAGLGDGGAGLGDAGTGLGDGGDGLGGDGTGLGDGSAGQSGGGAGLGDGGAGLGDAGTGLGDGGDGLGGDGTGLGDGSAGQSGGGAGLGDDGAGLGDAGIDLGDDGNGLGGDGTGSGDGSAGQVGGGAGTGDGQAGLGGDGANLGDAGDALDGDGTAAGDKTAGTAGGASGDQGVRDDSQSGAFEAPATDISCNGVASAKKDDDDSENVQHNQKNLIEVRNDGIKLSDPCQKQSGQGDSQ